MYGIVTAVADVLKKIIPEPVVRLCRPLYHACLAFLMAALYGFPARKLVVIGITGTKGKSTTADMLFALLRGAQYKTALLSTIRFAIEDDSEPNLHKMTLPGRGFAQAFMQKALARGCTHLVIEVTSESVLQYRHWFLSLDALIVTNIQREHIESHGSFENYVAAKRTIVKTLAHSPKKHRILVANNEIAESRAFLETKGVTAIGFGENDLSALESTETHSSFTYRGARFFLSLPGKFNALNALSAIKMAEALGISLSVASESLSKLAVVRGRTEHIDEGQPFLVIVDYAHTPDSLEALYGAFSTRRKICVLGNTGGGRDKWKRPLMGKIADGACDQVILTNEDPYDEDPNHIVQEMAAGMRRKPEIIMDRRLAIRSALERAQPGDAVLISGKGTDPFIMGPNGSKIPWSDAATTREELKRLR